MPETWKRTFTMLDAKDLTVDDNDYNSDNNTPLNCAMASKFLLEYKITENGVLVDGDRLQIKVEFSDKVDIMAGLPTWYIYQNGPFGYLAEEESTTPCNKSVSGDCIGEYMRITVRTDYTNITPTLTYFTVTVKVTLMK